MGPRQHEGRQVSSQVATSEILGPESFPKKKSRAGSAGGGPEWHSDTQPRRGVSRPANRRLLDGRLVNGWCVGFRVQGKGLMREGVEGFGCPNVLGPCLRRPSCDMLLFGGCGLLLRDSQNLSELSGSSGHHPYSSLAQHHRAPAATSAQSHTFRALQFLAALCSQSCRRALIWIHKTGDFSYSWDGSRNSPLR